MKNSNRNALLTRNFALLLCRWNKPEGAAEFLWENDGEEKKIDGAQYNTMDGVVLFMRRGNGQGTKVD